MAQSNQTEEHGDALSSKNNEAVVDIAKYKSPEEKVSSESSAFEQVMSQMNIAGRQEFDVQYNTYWQEASEEGKLLSVIKCEIDFFDNYNENYGHQGSAFMLLVIGLALKNTCEKHDCYLARYSGDEFAILLKGGDIESAQNIAESLRIAVEESRTEHKHSKVSDVVTLSIGISSVFPTSMTVLMKKSAMALYDAKRCGRNRVCSSVSLKNEESGLASSAEELEEIKEPIKSDFERLLSEMKINDRRDFNRYFVNTWQEATYEQELLSMVICEIDFFEEYCKNYTQQKGEKTLLVIASALKKQCEEFGCFIARLEDSKFVVLVKGGNATKGLKAAKMLRETIENLAIDHEHSPVKNVLTMSLGLSNIFPSDENSMKSLMTKVNRALSDAKSSGYDQVSVS